MNVDDVRELATGMFYLGSEAKANGLIDGLGNYKDAEIKAKELANITDASLITYEERGSILDAFSKLNSEAAYNFGRGFAREVTNIQADQDYQITAR